MATKLIFTIAFYPPLFPVNYPVHYQAPLIEEGLIHSIIASYAYVLISKHILTGQSMNLHTDHSKNSAILKMSTRSDIEI